MHELSVCQALIGQVEKVARENDAQRVIAITIAVGPLSGVEARLLEHAYPVAAAGTLAEHATLTIEAVPVRVRCRSCGAETGAHSSDPLEAAVDDHIYFSKEASSGGQGFGGGGCGCN